MFEEIKSLLVNELDIDADLITEKAQFIEDLKMNSLEVADLVVLCEDKYEIEVTESDIHSLLTVGDLASYIESKTK